MMHAITLWEPYASAVAAADPRVLGVGGKMVENRGWAPPPSIVGQVIAIHAAKRPVDLVDAREVLQMLNEVAPPRAKSWEVWTGQLAANAGKVVAVARVVGASKKRADFAPEQLRWKIEGQLGWMLKDVQALERPVLCRGLQGLWQLPGDVEAGVRRQVGL